MQLTSEQLKSYDDDGFLFFPNYFSQTEVDLLRSQIPIIFTEDTPRRVLEKDGSTVRSVYSSHTTNEVFRRLSQHPRLVEPARQLLKNEVYIHQFKINAKIAFGGDVWEWHQDYETWHKDDGMPLPEATSAVIFLDEVNEFNGPLILIPGSHKLRDSSLVDQGKTFAPADNSPEWMANLTSKLKFSLDQETIRAMVEERGMTAPKGPSGSVLFFHANLAHGSVHNMSPFDRNIVIVTYNSIENALVPVESPRPMFLASREFSAVVSLSDDVLSEANSQVAL